MMIADNVKIVREKINDAAGKSGRNSSEIVLVAAAKMNTSQSVREAIAAGVDAVGENRVQEMLEKSETGAYQGTRLHFIGHLQSNKVRQIVGLCDMIQSVDTVLLVEQISKRATTLGIKQDVLIEINIGREQNKSGVMREELSAVLEKASSCSGISVLGLMSVPPVIGNSSKIPNYFDEMYNLFVDIRAKKYDNICMNFLSMGMSDSFIEAISAGANMVRVGSAIFGDRQY